MTSLAVQFQERGLSQAVDDACLTLAAHVSEKIRAKVEDFAISGAMVGPFGSEFLILAWVLLEAPSANWEPA